MTLVSQTELIAGAIAGKVVSFPTDTVPALAVKPKLANLIFQIKRRPANKPLILMAASLDDLFPYISGTTLEFDIWQQIANKYFPGALTLVLPASDAVPNAINPTNAKTVGIRIPDSKIALEILSQTGILATTSANLSGESPLREMAKIAQAFPEVLVIKQESTITGSGLPSTVVQWKENNWQILRQGSVQFSSRNI
ncbi:MAG: L-threonylcarbamoyladenylate synthase [Xenococcaceae cyanobacterium MO_188.B19]|nr:L-threonylcarbamoyladenylate synthase [Xenococcaceae cyanobacterium MO_188.B19]